MCLDLISLRSWYQKLVLDTRIWQEYNLFWLKLVIGTLKVSTLDIRVM